MVRFMIIGAVIAVAFILYALVDAAMSDAKRARGVSKAVWVVLIVVLPVVGAILWFAIGRGRGATPVQQKAPDDDPRFTGSRMSNAELDEHMRDLEARLRELDDEVFPGEEAADSSAHTGQGTQQKPTEKPSAAPTEKPDRSPGAGGGEQNDSSGTDQKPDSL